jgi:hypothetical protein
MSFSNTYETIVLQWTFTNTSVTRPTAWYVALFTSDPGEASGGTELSGNGYARQSVAFTVTNDLATNSAAIEFPVDGSAWEIGSGVFDATAGTMTRVVSESSNSDAAINADWVGCGVLNHLGGRLGSRI